MNMRDLSSAYVRRYEHGLNAMKHVGLLLTQDCSMATVGAIGDAFRLANEVEKAAGEQAPYRLSVLSHTGGLIMSSSGISIWTQKLDQHNLSDFHAFFVACRDAPAAMESNDRLFTWLTRQGNIAPFSIQHGANLAITCKHPVQSTVPIFLFDDALTEAPAESATPADLALSLIERDLNAESVRKIARALQTRYVEHSKPELDEVNAVTTTEKIRESGRWIKENYSEAISVAQAAEFAAMSKRNFQRRFKCEFGMTPLEYLLRTRFEVVCTMLKGTDLPVDKIARRCGMGDGNRLGRLFKERYGLSPTQYRVQQRFELEDRIPSVADERVEFTADMLRAIP